MVRWAQPACRRVSGAPDSRSSFLAQRLQPGLERSSGEPVPLGSLVQSRVSTFHQPEGTSGHPSWPLPFSVSPSGYDGWGLFGQHQALEYLWCQGGTFSPALNKEAQLHLPWVRSLHISLVPQLIMGVRNVVTDSLSCHQQVLSSKWTLAQDVVTELLAKWPMTIDLFATSPNYRLSVYFSPSADPWLWGPTPSFRVGTVSKLMCSLHSCRFSKFSTSFGCARVLLSL